MLSKFGGEFFAGGFVKKADDAEKYNAGYARVEDGSVINDDEQYTAQESSTGQSIAAFEFASRRLEIISHG